MTSSTPQESPKPDSIDSEDKPSINKGFLSSTIDELKLVVWPSRQQLFSESIAVILMVSLSAASIAAVSRFYGWGASHIFR
ncbi:preprotein translocase subunit SecE [Prochlorococcus marinus]|uniref:preprotein translocase subunit SecE n=1 Tax=Prochlorococcus marinus TaxID=1219 RepID=UPI0022B58C77|nr:preprotein translocase subunit SecE [Prochlorococcus marinus]